MDQVGPFRLGRVLGSGGQGVVRSAVHEGTGTAVAVKLTTADGEAARRIREEVSVLADLDHPNVVRLWGAGVTEGRAWFAMELARTTLAAEPPSDWSTTRAVLRQLLSALGHVHARDLLHLDVKPANVLLGCEDGSDELGPVPGLRLSDFGVGGGRGGPVTGTPGYAPPEQLRGAWREIGPVSDLFALGETTYRWVTGRPRFAGTPAEILRAQLRDAPTPFVPRFPVPPWLEEWLRWLLDPRPTARPQRAVEALEALPGEVVDRSVPVPAALSAEPTWMGDAPLDEPSVELPRALASRPASPTRGWQVPEPWSRVRWLADGGLGPVTSRLPRFVGRVDARDRLWSALQRVRASGAPGVVRIRGVCPGAGASRLASWFGGRIHETDQGVVLRYQPGDDLASMLRREARADGLSGLALIDRMRSAGRGWGFPDDAASALGEVVADGADPVALATRIPAGRPLVLIHDLPGYQEAWSPLLAPMLAEPHAAVLVVFVTDRDDLPGEVIEVGPLTLGEGDALLDRWLGLSRALADELFVASGGVPGAMFRWLRALDERGELRAGPAGFVATGPLPELLPAGGMPADPVSWLDAVVRGQVADPVFRAAVLRSVPPEVASAAWARAAELPSTSASTTALRWWRAGHPERATVFVRASVDGGELPSADSVALSLASSDRDDPAWWELRFRIAAHRGLRDALDGLDGALALARARGWTATAASLLEVEAWRALPTDRGRAVAATAEALRLFAEAGHEDGVRRARRQLATYEVDPRLRAEGLRADLADPRYRVRALQRLAWIDPPRWAAALAEAEAGAAPWFAAESDLLRAEAASMVSEHDAADALLLRSARSHRARVDVTWSGAVCVARANLARRRGRLAEAVDGYLTAIDQSRHYGSEAWDADLQGAATLLALGDPASARRLLGRLARPHPYLTALRFLVTFALALGESERDGDAERFVAEWDAFWRGPGRPVATYPWLGEWWPLARSAAEARGIALSWPDPEPTPP